MSVILKGEIFMLVYKIANKINGKACVGQIVQNLKYGWNFMSVSVVVD